MRPAGNSQPSASQITQSPPSYLYLNGCTNYGGNIAVGIVNPQ